MLNPNPFSSKNDTDSRESSDEQTDLSEVVVGGGDPRIAELVAEARREGYKVQDRSSGPLNKDIGNFRPYGYESADE